MATASPVGRGRERTGDLRAMAGDKGGTFVFSLAAQAWVEVAVVLLDGR